MLPLLVFLPVITSLILGIRYLSHGDGPPAIKIVGSVVFGTALYLQFFSRHSLAGMLLQIVLAVSLAVWRKAEASR